MGFWDERNWYSGKDGGRGLAGGGTIEEYFKVWKFQPYTEAAKIFKVAVTLSRSYIYSYFEILTPKGQCLIFLLRIYEVCLSIILRNTHAEQINTYV